MGPWVEFITITWRLPAGPNHYPFFGTDGTLFKSFATGEILAKIIEKINPLTWHF